MARNSILDRVRPYVRQVRPRPLQLAVAVAVFEIALVVEPRRTLYGRDGRYRPPPPGTTIDTEAITRRLDNRRPTG